MRLSFLLIAVFVSQINAEEIERIEVRHTGDFPSLHSIILDRAEFEESSLQLSDIIAKLPSIQIRRNTGLGNPAQISIRGSNSQQVNLFIDGQLVNSGQSGSFDLDQLPTALIESVEINQSQSSGSGPTPIGGEIRITTIKPDGDATNGFVSLGTIGYSQVNVKHSTQLNNEQALLTSFNYLKSDNNYDFLVPQTIQDSNTSKSQKLANSRFEKYTGFVSHDWQHSRGDSSVSLQYNQQYKQVPNFQNNNLENASVLEADKWQVSNQQNWISPWSTKEDMQLALNWSQLDETYRHRPNLSKNDTYQYTTEQHFASLKLPVRSNNWLWQPFVNFDQQKFGSASLINQAAPLCNGVSACDIRAKRQDINFGQKLAWYHNTWPINATWVFSKTDSDSKNISLIPKHITSPLNAEVTNEDEFISQEFNAQAQWRDHTLSVQLSRGVRQPTMYELFGDRGSFKGNGSLLPEESQGVSLSLLHLFNTISIQHTVFQQTNDNAIVAIFNSRGVGSFQNVSSVYLLGYSITADWQLSQHWQLGTTLDWLDSDTFSTFTAFDNKHQPGVYHKEIDVFVRWQISDSYSIKLDHYLGTDLYYDRANKITSNNGETSEREVTNLSVHYDFGRFSFTGRVSNLFDNLYRDLSNEPSQGRQIQFTLKIKEF